MNARRSLFALCAFAAATALPLAALLEAQQPDAKTTRDYFSALTNAAKCLPRSVKLTY